MRIAILISLSLATPLFAQDYSVNYNANFLGLPVGSGELAMNISGRNYTISTQAKIKGVAAMFAGGSATINASGVVGENRLHGRSVITEVKSKTQDKYHLEMANDNVSKFTMTPHKDPHPAALPLKDEHKRNIYDPLAATFIFAKSPEQALSPETCDRTVPIFSGRLRFETNLKYIRTEQVETEGYKGKALVCEGKVNLIAGYRTDNNAQQDVAKNITTYWLVPVKNSKMLMVYRVDLKTKFGTAIITADKMKIGY